jgi:hypothetical protein
MDDFNPAGDVLVELPEVLRWNPILTMHARSGYLNWISR